MRTGKDNHISEEERLECARLKRIYDKKRRELNTTQERIALEMGITQGAVSHYLNGKNALNVQAAIKFSRILEEPIWKFSPRLSKEINTPEQPNEALHQLMLAALKLSVDDIEILTSLAHKLIFSQNNKTGQR